MEEQTHSQDNHSAWNCTFELNLDFIHISVFLLFLLIFTAGLVGNVLVLWVNWRRRRSSHGVLLCLLNVCVSDTLMVATLPFFMMEALMSHVWLWGEFLCKFTNFVYVVNLYSSSLFLALMTLERYLSLATPAGPALFPAVGRRRWWVCGGVWLWSLVLGLLENVHVGLEGEDKQGCFMMPEHNWFEWYFAVALVNVIFQFLGPCAVIVACNVLIARAVRANPDVRDTRKVWLVHVYSGAFVLCWFPHHLVTLLIRTDEVKDFIFSCNFYHLLHYFQNIVQIWSLFHCVLNPILYSFLSKSFRNNLYNNVVTYMNREENAVQLESGGGRGGGRAGRGERGAGHQRQVSDASTSQSDTGS